MIKFCSTRIEVNHCIVMTAIVDMILNLVGNPVSLVETQPAAYPDMDGDYFPGAVVVNFQFVGIDNPVNLFSTAHNPFLQFFRMGGAQKTAAGFAGNF